jgi:hypothetical protein
LVASQLNYVDGGEACKMQAKYHEDGKFQSHGLTSWPRIFKMFPNSLLKFQDNANIKWVTHLELDWEYVIIVLEKTGELLWPHFNPSHKMGNYVIFVAPHLD